MATYVVNAGESIPSIAKDQGFFWETIWNHSKNADLKALRKDPNILFEGDEVFIPDLEKKQESRPADAHHRFRRKGEPVKLRLRLLAFGEPRANEDYTLDIEGSLIQGKTDGDGKIEKFIPGNAKSGKVLLKGGKESYSLSISRLDPIDTTSGVQQRLANLGYGCGAITGEMDDATTDAVKAFQSKNGLSASGEADAATKAKLKEQYGS